MSSGTLERSVGGLVDQTVTELTQDRVPLTDYQIEADASLHSRTDMLVTTLGDEIERARVAIDAANTDGDGYARQFRIGLRQAVDARDWGWLGRHGLDMSGIRTDSLTSVLVSGRPVEVQTMALSIEARGGVFATERFSSTLNHADTVGAAVGGFIRRLAPVGGGSMRQNIVLDLKPNGDGIHGAWPTGLRVLGILSTLGHAEVIHAEDTPGGQFHFDMVAPEDRERVASLVTKLQHSPYGVLEVDDRNVAFRPHPAYMSHFADLTQQSKYLEHFGLQVWSCGVGITDSGGRAAALLERDPAALQLTILDDVQRDTVQEADALAWAAGSKIERNQHIFFDGTVLTSDLLHYALATRLLDGVTQFKKTIGLFSQPEVFQTDPYLDHHYGEDVVVAQLEARAAREQEEVLGMLEEDVLSEQAIMDELDLHCRNRQLGDVIDLGCGPTNDWARLLEPYLRPDARVTMIDRSPYAIAHQQRWIAGTLAERHAAIAPRHEAMYVRYRNGGSQYKDCDARARQRMQQQGEVKQGNALELAPESCEVITDGYFSCSAFPEYGGFVGLQRVKFDALVPGGRALSRHMMETDQWFTKDPDTGKNIYLPSVYLEDESLKRAYELAGFVNVRVTPILAKGAKARPGYGYMAVVYAEKPAKPTGK